MPVELPGHVTTSLQDHPSPIEDRGWILEGLANDAEALIGQNRRFMSTGSRRLYGFRFQTIHQRLPVLCEWFTEVFGRRPILGELNDWQARQAGDLRLSGPQAFSLLTGAISIWEAPRMRLYERQLRIAHLLPFVIEYMGYRLHFVPEVGRFLEGLSGDPFPIVPNFVEMNARNYGATVPTNEWHCYMWSITLEGGVQNLYGDWRRDEGRWAPVFTGRERPAHAPVPVPILEIRPYLAPGDGPTVVTPAWDPWAQAVANGRVARTSVAGEPEPEVAPDDPSSASTAVTVPPAPRRIPTVQAPAVPRSERASSPSPRSRSARRLNDAPDTARENTGSSPNGPRSG